LTSDGKRLMTRTPATVVAPRNKAEFRAARRLRPPAIITLATVKPSGILCRKMAKKSTQPSQFESAKPEPMATPSKKVWVARPNRTE
jgi:hypothetical protein